MKRTFHHVWGSTLALIVGIVAVGMSLKLGDLVLFVISQLILAGTLRYFAHMNIYRG